MSELELISRLREEMRKKLSVKHVWSRNTVIELIDEISISIIDCNGKQFFDAVYERKREDARKAASVS